MKTTISFKWTNKEIKKWTKKCAGKVKYNEQIKNTDCFY